MLRDIRDVANMIKMLMDNEECDVALRVDTYSDTDHYHDDYKITDELIGKSADKINFAIADYIEKLLLSCTDTDVTPSTRSAMMITVQGENEEDLLWAYSKPIDRVRACKDREYVCACRGGYLYGAVWDTTSVYDDKPLMLSDGSVAVGVGAYTRYVDFCECGDEDPMLFDPEMTRDDAERAIKKYVDRILEWYTVDDPTRVEVELYIFDAHKYREDYEYFGENDNLDYVEIEEDDDEEEYDEYDEDDEE